MALPWKVATFEVLCLALGITIPPLSGVGYEIRDMPYDDQDQPGTRETLEG